MAVRGTRGARCLLLGVPAAGQAGRRGAPCTWASMSQHGGHCLVEASLFPQLLRKRREHAQVGKVFDVIVAGPLGWIPWHGQHVLQERRQDSAAESAHPPGHRHVPGAQPASHPHGHLSKGAAQEHATGHLRDALRRSSNV